MKSSYEIIPKLITPSIKGGETVEIELFMSGYGKVIKNKLNVTFSSKKMFDMTNPSFAEYNIVFAVNEKTGEKFPFADKTTYSKINLDPTGATINLNEGFFSDVESENNLKMSKVGFPQIMPERVFERQPPFRFSFNTNKDTPAGNYDIDFVLTYSDGDEITTNHKKVTIHVKSFLEKYEKKFKLIGLFLTGIGLIAGITLAIIGLPMSPSN